ncbi:MAG TPA: hypothetical protein VGV12_02480 [Gemmatimonadales bacterium]|nr:hypothetical protein [Gemmatimonadales bacterium]
MSSPSPDHPPLPGLRLPLRRRRLGSGATLALITHAVVIGLLLARVPRLAGRPGNGSGSGQRINFFALPSSGGGAPAAVDVAAPPRITVADVSVLRGIPLDLPPLDLPAPTLAPPAAVLGGGGGAGAGGQGTARGSGAGPGSGTGGEGGYILSAQPRRVIPRPPECIVTSVSRGRIEVSFWVAADGQPTRVEVDPPPTDQECRRAFVTLMMETRFVPATLRGQPVASVFSIRYSSH